MQRIATKDSGNFTVQLTSQHIKWANGTEFTEYKLTRLHKTRPESSGDMVKTYKRLETAMKNYEAL